MYVTFIIGNGFDLSLGMKTRYTDVYAEYMKEKSNNPTIQALKKELANNYENWTDFEMGMAEYAGKLKDERELIECVRDFRKFLTGYLKREEKDFLDKIKGNEELKRFCNEFQMSLARWMENLTPNARRDISYVGLERRFLTFNYTKILSGFVDIASSKLGFINKETIHIHNDLNSTILLGVDDQDQVPMPLSAKGKRTFVKRLFNDQYDNARVDKVNKTIHSSSTICIYGWSMGASDRCWVNAIAEWLEADKDHHLVWFPYGTPKFESYEMDAQMDEEDNQREILMEKLNLSGQYSTFEKQLHIVLGKGIFNFPSLDADIPTATNK
jgi:hypothetical protein